jgi:hypothetical protein
LPQITEAMLVTSVMSGRGPSSQVSGGTTPTGGCFGQE